LERLQSRGAECARASICRTFLTHTCAQAEAAAKAAKAAAAAPAASAAPEVLEVVVTEIVDGNTLYLQIIGAHTQQLEQMMNRLRQVRRCTARVA
jgi:hypothetical protein